MALLRNPKASTFIVYLNRRICDAFNKPKQGTEGPYLSVSFLECSIPLRRCCSGVDMTIRTSNMKYIAARELKDVATMLKYRGQYERAYRKNWPTWPKASRGYPGCGRVGRKRADRNL